MDIHRASRLDMHSTAKSDAHAQKGRLLRASAEQWITWLRAAKRAGLSLSAWIRAALDAAARK